MTALSALCDAGPASVAGVSFPEPPETVSVSAFRDAMARVPASVNIVTTDGIAGLAGTTATAVCSVTDTPPTLLVCLNRNHRLREVAHRNGVLAVNVLRSGDEEISAIFAGQRGLATMEARFEHGSWRREATGSPIYERAIVAFDCVVDQIVEVGTHSVVHCLVRGVMNGDAAPNLVYVGRRYATVG